MDHLDRRILAAFCKIPLLGGFVVSEAATAGKAVSAVVAALRSVSVTEEQVAGAKKQLLADIYTLMEDPLQTVENMGVQVVSPSSHSSH